MNMKIKNWLGMLLVWGTVCGAAELPSAVVYDFSRPRTYEGGNFRCDALYWSVKNGRLSNKQSIPQTVELEFGDRNWADYEVEIQVRFLKAHAEDHHFGIIARQEDNKGIRFYARDAECLYIADSRHDSAGRLEPALKIGPDSDWHLFRYQVKNGKAAVFLDNKLIGTVDNLQSFSGTVRLVSHNLDVEISRIKVTLLAVKQENAGAEKTRPEKSPNILRNSSFELCTLDRLPDFYGVWHWGIGDPEWAIGFERWQNSFGVDETTAYDGRRSLRIVNPTAGEKSALTMTSTLLGSEKSRPYIFSAYLKADRSPFKVNFNGTTIEVTDQWKRYSGDFRRKENDFYSDMVSIGPVDAGTLWIDALQLEPEKLTAYAPMEKSAAKAAAGGDSVEKVRSCSATMAEGGIKLDGRLEEAAWKQAEPMVFSGISGGKIQHPAEAKVLWGKQGIYIGVICRSSAPIQESGFVKGRDQTVWVDDSLELFINPYGDGDFYYHLALNSNNTQFDAKVNDSSWNAAWQSATQRFPAEKVWSAEIFLPFHQLNFDRRVGENWRFNIGRNNRGDGECSVWSPTFGGFHTPERFGKIRFAGMDIQKYLFGIADCRLTSLTPDSCRLELLVDNQTGALLEGNWKVGLYSRDAKEIAVETFPAKLSPGKNRISRTFQTASPVPAECDAGVALAEPSGALLLEVVRHVRLQAPLEVFTRYSVYVPGECVEAEVAGGSGEIRTRIVENSGKVCCETVCRPAAGDRISLPLKQLSPGTYRLEIQRGTLSAHCAFDVVDVPSDNIVRSDHFRRMITVNGKAFFPFGITLEQNRTPEVLRYYAGNGFNTFVFYAKAENLEETRKLLEEAQKTGSKLIIALGDAAVLEKKLEIVRQFKAHPAVLAWNAFDEIFTMKWGMENYEEVCRQVKELQAADPSRPVFINENPFGMGFLNSGKLDFPGKIVSYDYYPYPPSGNLLICSEYVKTLAQIAEKGRRPVWVFLMGAGYAFWGSRDHTPAEHDFVLYSAIVHGGRGVSYFADHPKSATAYRRMRELNQEVNALLPVFSGEKVNVEVSNPAVAATAYSCDGTIYVIAVNESFQAQHTKFFIDGKAREMEVLFEERKISAEGGLFQDEFKPIQRHVYREVK